MNNNILRLVGAIFLSALLVFFVVTLALITDFSRPDKNEILVQSWSLTDSTYRIISGEEYFFVERDKMHGELKVGSICRLEKIGIQRWEAWCDV